MSDKTVEEFLEECINDVEHMSDEESKKCLEELKKWEHIGPTVEEYFKDLFNDCTDSEVEKFLNKED